MRKQVTDWEEISVKDTADKELFSKIYIEVLNLNNKINSPVFFNGPNTLIDTSPKNIDRWQEAYEKVYHITCHQGNAN